MKEDNSVDGRTLSSKLNYIGMERAVRRLAIEEKLTDVEKIAVMSELEVCELVARSYELVYAESEEVGLVRKEDLPEYMRLVKTISR